MIDDINSCHHTSLLLQLKALKAANKKYNSGAAADDDQFYYDMAAMEKEYPVLPVYQKYFGDHPSWGFARKGSEYMV